MYQSCPPVRESSRILVVDIGTTYWKAGVFQSKKCVRLWKSYAASADITHCQEWIKQACRNTQADAVVITGHGPTIVPIDENGKPLHRPLLWYEQKGTKDTVSYYLSQILCYRDEYPTHYTATKYFLPFPEFLSFALGAPPQVVLPSAAYRPYIWDEKQIAHSGLSFQKFPPFTSYFSFFGKVSHSIARESELASEIPIICGGTDYLLSLAGTGIARPEMACLRMGTTTVLNVCTDASVQLSRFQHLPHVLPHLSVGAYYFSEELPRILSRIDKGDHIARLATVFTKLKSFFPTASESWLLQQLGTAICIREVLSQLTIPSLKIMACGGPSHVKAWVQWYADIINHPLICPEVRDAELLGGYCLALTVSGEYSNLTEAMDDLVKEKEIVIPREQGWIAKACSEFLAG